MFVHIEICLEKAKKHTLLTKTEFLSGSGRKRKERNGEFQHPSRSSKKHKSLHDSDYSDRHHHHKGRRGHRGLKEEEHNFKMGMGL